jgi:hypothetical protein
VALTGSAKISWSNVPTTRPATTGRARSVGVEAAPQVGTSER